MAAGDDVVVGDYILDFGYDPAFPQAGGATTLAFNFADAKAQTALSPESVWVRISLGDKIVFSGVEAAQNGNVTMTFDFPEPGDYAIDASYRYQGNDIKTTFPLKVSSLPPAVSNAVEHAAIPSYVIAAAVLAVLIAVRIRRGKRAGTIPPRT